MNYGNWGIKKSYWILNIICMRYNALTLQHILFIMKEIINSKEKATKNADSKIFYNEHKPV